jgi:hypothetical protein
MSYLNRKRETPSALNIPWRNVCGWDWRGLGGEDVVTPTANGHETLAPLSGDLIRVVILILGLK